MCEGLKSCLESIQQTPTHKERPNLHSREALDTHLCHSTGAWLHLYSEVMMGTALGIQRMTLEECHTSGQCLAQKKPSKNVS